MQKNWNFENTYLQLPNIFYSKTKAEFFPNLKVLLKNENLINILSIDSNLYLVFCMILSNLSLPRWVIIALDLFLSLLALLFAYIIRFDLKADETLIREEWNILSKSIALYVIVKFIVFYFFRIHKGLIRHTSTEDLRRIVLASFVSSITFAIFGFIRANFFDGYFLFPTSVLLIEFLASVLLLLGSRFAVKLIYIESIKSKEIEDRVLIYGAGISGLITKRTIEKDILSMHYALCVF